MAKWMRLAAVGVSLLVTGMAFTAAGFTLFEAAHSDAAIGALTLVLFAGNFALLQRGIRWALRPRAAVSVDAPHGHRRAAALAVPR